MNRLLALALFGWAASTPVLAQPTDSTRTDNGQMEQDQMEHDGMAHDGMREAAALDISALSPEMTVVQNAAGQPELSALVAAIQAASLAETLGGDGPFTVFAPVNAAFAAVPGLDMLLADRARLAPVLTFHVVPGRLMAADLTDGATLTTVNGQTLTVAVTATGVTVNGATVVAPDITSSNGVVHVIDTVLMPAPVERMRLQEAPQE